MARVLRQRPIPLHHISLSPRRKQPFGQTKCDRMVLCHRRCKCNSCKDRSVIGKRLQTLTFETYAGRWAMNLKRRAFVASLSAAIAARAIPTSAQQTSRLRTVGVLMGLANDQETQARAKVLEQGLAKRGWVIGQNIHIEYRFAAGNEDRMHAFAKELITLHPDVIVGHSTPVVSALLQATRTIPIVFVVVSDPIGSGFVTSLARPGGNITGFTNLQRACPTPATCRDNV
jgi:hypothetical protein